MKAEEIFKVRGLAVVVTGAASGLGLACAEVLAANGARVTLMDRDATALDRQHARLAAAGYDVRAEVVDVTDCQRVEAAFAAATAAHGRLDVAFVNAGIGGGPGFLNGRGERDPASALESFPEERWNTGIAGNLSSVFWSLQAAVRHMKPQGTGRIVVTTSIAALKTEAGIGIPYMAAKAAVAHLVRQAALELARYGIRVNAIAPGPFLTNIAGGKMFDPAVRAHHERVVPLKRMAEPAEVMGLALFLASNASSYVTGAQIVIDGGATLGTAD